MIGDAARILNAVRDRNNLRKAYRYALRDRLQDNYYDHFELDNASQNEDTVIAELVEELRTPTSYKPKPAYAHYPPKNELCYRRMIYIPFKDLVLRYAFVIVVSNLIDPELSSRCFANRRARGKAAHTQFLVDFANESWPRFCTWQKECATDSRFTSLLRTDISSFYDSVSHEYLVTAIEQQLAIQPQSELMELFRTLLRVPVISYSHLTGKPGDPETTHQGLMIGNNTEGVLANLHLKPIDEAMGAIKGIQFGRYNDDMRIFAADRESARQAALILQEHLLTRGLNLNAAKTEFAEGAARVEELRSKAYEAYDYLEVEEEQVETGSIPITDLPFDEFNRRFEPGQDFQKDRDAKEFCHFLGRVLPLADRQPAHVDMLKNVLARWHGSSKYASWRLVESIIRNQCPAATRAHATKILLECLSERSVSTYAKYRILHYLVRTRTQQQGNGVYRFIEKLNRRARNEIKGLLPTFLGEPAFELNIIALYAMKVLGASHAELETAVRNNSPKPVGVPIRNALILAAEPAPLVEGFALAEVSENEGQEEYH